MAAQEDIWHESPKTFKSLGSLGSFKLDAAIKDVVIC